MRITVAGFGNLGSYVAELLGQLHQIAIYDPPRGLGRLDDLREPDFVFIAVPTPSLRNGECDTSIVEEIVSAAYPKEAIVCHSTVPTGTTDRLIRFYGKPLVYVPEYAGESPDHPYRRMEN